VVDTVLGFVAGATTKPALSGGFGMNAATSSFLMDQIDDLIFVFGSNQRGIHGAGAAKAALQWGAQRGVGRGLQGRTYAIPTKAGPYTNLTLPQIQWEVDAFIQMVSTHPDLKFLVTPIGTGLAGHSAKVIAPFFKPLISAPNVALPIQFLKALELEHRQPSLLQSELNTWIGAVSC
jgi:hypothetical protein